MKKRNIRQCPKKSVLNITENNSITCYYAESHGFNKTENKNEKKNEISREQRRLLRWGSLPIHCRFSFQTFIEFRKLRKQTKPTDFNKTLKKQITKTCWRSLRKNNIERNKSKNQYNKYFANQCRPFASKRPTASHLSCSWLQVYSQVPHAFVVPFGKYNGMFLPELLVDSRTQLDAQFRYPRSNPSLSANQSV